MAGETRFLRGVNVIGGVLALDTIALITLATQTTSESAYIGWASLLFALAIPILTAAYLMESNEEDFGYAASWFRSAARLKDAARQGLWDRIWPITLATVWSGFILSAAGVLLLATDLLESHQPIGVPGWLILGVAIVGAFLLWRWHRTALQRLGVVTAADLEDSRDA
jgi:hypothetical protein